MFTCINRRIHIKCPVYGELLANCRVQFTWIGLNSARCLMLVHIARMLSSMVMFVAQHHIYIYIRQKLQYIYLILSTIIKTKHSLRLHAIFAMRPSFVLLVVSHFRNKCVENICNYSYFLLRKHQHIVCILFHWKDPRYQCYPFRNGLQ